MQQFVRGPKEESFRHISSEDQRKKTETLLQKWRSVARRVGKQRNWTKECMVKVLNESKAGSFEGDNLQGISFDTNGN